MCDRANHSRGTAESQTKQRSPFHGLKSLGMSDPRAVHLFAHRGQEFLFQGGADEEPGFGPEFVDFVRK